MNRFIYQTFLVVLFALSAISLNAQKNKNSLTITASDLESHVAFLASPLLEGRMNGEEGLEIAGRYIASQAQLTGLKPANGNSFFQPYKILKKVTDPDKSVIQVISGNKDTITNGSSFHKPDSYRTLRFYPGRRINLCRIWDKG